MTTSIRATSKSRGRPKTTGQGLQIPVRVHDPLLSALDAFAADQAEPALTRPEAMRRAATEHLRAKGYLGSEGTEPASVDAQDAPGLDRYVDADPDEGVMVTGIGPMTLRRAVRKLADWREHHGIGLVNVYRGSNKRPGMFDEADLGRLAEMERFR